MGLTSLFNLPLNFISSKFSKFTEFLFEKCDPTPLAIFRILFGFLMILDVPQERGLEDVDLRFGDPNYCFFPLFEWIQPVTVQIACVLYSIMWAGAVGIMFGFKFRSSCLIFLGPYLYFFLLDKSRWNNHSYLFALFTIILAGSGAGNHLSMDSVMLPMEEKVQGVPKWNYFLLKFQIFILYFYAGVKKLDSDWLSGYSMKNLSRHKIFAPMKLIIDGDVIEYYMIHMGGLMYDLSVGFMLNFEISKKLGVFLSVAFHGLNSQIFDIGMFPYVCLASLILFCTVEEFPCSLFAHHSHFESSREVQCHKSVKKFKKCSKSKKNNGTIQQNVTSGLIIFYILLQLFMPFSHFVTRGFNNWTPGLYGYSWDMMVNSWETLHQKVTVTNRLTRQERYLDPDVWVANDRWSSHADMAIQYAQCIKRNLGRFNITDIEVNLDIWKSLNGRFQQRIYDPRVDILQAPWSPLAPVTWVLPLLKEFSHYRRNYFESISHSVANWTSGSSDVIFVADFPGLHLENYLPKDLTNISVTIISGEILIEQKGNCNVTLSSWSGSPGAKSSQSILAGEFHKIHTISYPNPSSYMYTYTNATEQAQEKEAQNRSQSDKLDKEGSWAKGVYQIFKDFFDFFVQKVEIFARCLYLVLNAHLNLIFDVPMVLRKTV